MCDESMKDARERERERAQADGKTTDGFTRKLITEMVSGKICNREIREICDWETNGEKSHDGGGADDEKRHEEAREVRKHGK